MICSACGMPQELAFEILRNVPGAGPQKRIMCFACLSEAGENIMRERRKACPTCHTPPTGWVQPTETTREFQTCANGHKW